MLVEQSKSSTKVFELKQAKAIIQSQIPLKHCLWLLITIFLQVLILFFLIRRSPRAPESGAQHLSGLNRPECRTGYVYVYDLPPTFNTEYIEKCHELELWNKGCRTVSNSGFGPAARQLDGIVPKNLLPAFYWTDKFSAEVIYHNRILSHRCRTQDPEKATGFYIPFYAGLDIGKFLLSSNFTAKDRDLKSEMLLEWLNQQPTFVQAKGTSHFIVLGRLTYDFRRLSDKDSEWGSSFLRMSLMKNVFRLGVEKHLNDDYEESFPYPTGFHPRSGEELAQWQNFIRTRARGKLFSFVGTKRDYYKNDFRGLIMNYCKDEAEACHVVDCEAAACADGSPAVMKTFLDSDFCLQPRGNALTRRSVFDCMLAGSIPVYFWKGTFKGQYEWHLPWTSETFTVFIDKDDVRSTNGTLIRKVLENIHKDKLKEMRETLINLVPKLVYAANGDALGDVKDALDISIERVLTRLKTHKDQLLAQS